METPVAHTTGHEMKFLENLGTFTAAAETQKSLLDNYIKAAARRSDWGSMDRLIVIKFAESLRDEL